MITAFEAKELTKQSLLDIPGVSGVGVSSGSEERINIYVVEKTPDLEAKIPSNIQGIETRIIETGEIKALPLSVTAMEVSRMLKYRPAQPGVSVGNVGVSAGTLGAIVRDNLTGKIGILSNAHVLVSNPMYSTMDDYRVTQPGIYDGANISDVIGSTIRWITINPYDNNYVDCALAIVDNPADINDEIIELGRITGVGEPIQNMRVIKSGRSSGVTEGTIIDTKADIKVGYKGFTAQFVNQCICTSIGIPGDSGSLVLDKSNNNAVALLFAGSDSITIITPISRVLSNLNVSFIGSQSSSLSASGLMLPIILGGAFGLLYYTGDLKL